MYYKTSKLKLNKLSLLLKMDADKLCRGTSQAARELSAKDKLNFLLSTNFDYENFSLTWIPKDPFR